MVDPGRRRALHGVAALLLIVYGCETPTRPDTAEPQSPDSAITSRVKSALAANPRVRAELIEVDTANGVVRLSGFADSRIEADTAVSITNDVPGVKRVQDDIVVRVSRDRRP
jgi:hyperosmotically inducible periplasmic protein